MKEQEGATEVEIEHGKGRADRPAYLSDESE